MNIAIIGGGFTGLTAAYELTKRGHRVTVFEKDRHLGGLAWGFKKPGWNWHLEAAYHHLFTNDRAIMNLACELGIGDKLIVKRPITANLLPNSKLSFESRKTVRIVQLDSATHLFHFPLLSPLDKLRTGALVLFCKLYPFWQTLEGITAKEFFIRWGGKRAWEIIWEPLMTGKFGHFDSTIAASWLWARIHKRTPSLVYIDGGFQTLVAALTDAIRTNGGTIRTEATLSSLPEGFDRILLTVPTPIAYKLAPRIRKPDPLTIPHLHAQVLILETRKPILDTTYWLSITDRSFPFLAVVAHTNFMDKRHYGGHHLTYIGNYLPEGHPYLKLTKEQLLKTFAPYIKKLSHRSLKEAGLVDSYLFVGPYAQPVHHIRYSQKAPKLETAVPGVYLANMDSIYPWDRGTNYAVALGQKAARMMDAASRNV